jgi:hypothetical protein
MNQAYWLSRKRASVSAARASTDSIERLVHLDLAGRYSVFAANCNYPFLLSAPSTEAEQAALMGPTS